MSKKEDINKESISDNGVEKEQLNSETEVVAEEEVQSESEKLQEELALEKDKFLRLFAEFENYKKRTAKERNELFKTAGQDIMSSMLPVLDDFERALSEISKTKEKELFKGVELIRQKMKNVLGGHGLSEIETKAGDNFDAEIHDAITQIPAPSADLKGKIVDVIEKGYTLSDKIIRHPKVVVGQQ
ncbi:nucleotide exchange factor GrpE [Galbibacter sp.]|jgi:molecular chaperone GrpE|uniref:nucleotide exchange factor GrpE n=1 Tax=Galbibacter sp. TaxID=2918471 RepID=UPI003A90C945